MLKKLTTKTYFLLAYVLVCSVHIYATTNHQLFGDEAFYWLEGQWLAWSYSEIPGWTPWTLALMDWLLPQHHFNIRIPNLIAALSIPWLGIFITNTLTNEPRNSWPTGLLLLTLPILGVAGTLAIPDLWITFFTLLAVWSLINIITSKSNHHFLILGLILALGINVHLRFWLITLISCAVIFWQFRAQTSLLYKFIKLTFPIMLLGFIPVLLFNINHDFPLLSFQLKDRHPWEFQTAHFNFFLIQIAITTPWVFYLCLKNITSLPNEQGTKNSQQLILRTITSIALIHWLVYAILGFFSDTLRLNVHWTLVSYVLLLLVTVHNTTVSSRLIKWATVTGITANLWLLITLSYWLNEKTPQSQINARITHHAQGWQQLAAHTDKLLHKENRQDLLTDHFMTLAQLRFYSQEITTIKTLQHPLNTMHGRTKQLEIMELLQEKSHQPQILLVEHNALKLTEMITFYQSACEQLNGIKLIDSLNISQGLKRYHYFKTGINNNQTCEIPPIVYYDHAEQKLSGWILHQKNKPIDISLYDATKQTILNKTFKLNIKTLGSNPLFANLNPSQYQLLEFKLQDTLQDMNPTLQLKIKTPKHTIYSQRLILNQ